jgi:UDP-N-acetylglucosamine 4,6-dehydratase
MKNEKIFITGGAGYLGQNLIKQFYDTNQITVYSRDEAKHYYIKKQFPKVNFVVGDIRNRDLLLRKSKNHTVGIFAASLKQIDACTENYEEASKIIIDGAFNSRICAEENNFKSACFISSDKSRAATTIYGAMKYVAGEGFISGPSNCNLTTAIYGNVMNSTGSIIPLIWKYINQKTKLQLYSTEMTRFLLDIEDGIDLICKALTYSGCNVIMNAKSFKILDLFEIYKEKYNLEFEVSSPRTGEKIHEIMAASEEIRRMEYIEKDNIFLLHPNKNFNTVVFKNSEFSSKDYCISKEELFNFLNKRNFYQP